MSDIVIAAQDVRHFTQSMSADAETSCSILATALAAEAAEGGVPIEKVLRRVRDDHATLIAIIAETSS